MAAFIVACWVGCGPPVAEVERTFAVVHAAPHHGAVEVERNVEPLLAFSAPVDPSSLGAILLREHAADGASTVEVTRFLDDDGLVVILVPERTLAPSTEHAIEVGTSLLAADGAELGAPYRSSFFTVSAGEAP